MSKGKIVGLIIAAVVFALVGWVVTLSVDDIQTSTTMQQNCINDGGVYITSRDFEVYCVNKDSLIDLRS